MRGFLDDMGAVTPPDAPAACLPLTAAVRRYCRDLDGGGVRAPAASHYWVQPHVARWVDQAPATWLNPGHLRQAAAVADLGLLACCLVGARPHG